jgi:hypothetical protein
MTDAICARMQDDRQGPSAATDGQHCRKVPVPRSPAGRPKGAAVEGDGQRSKRHLQGGGGACEKSSKIDRLRSGCSSWRLIRVPRIHLQEAPKLRVVDAAPHVDEAEVVLVFVAGEADAADLGDEGARRGLAPCRLPARPEGVITAPLEDAAGIGGDEVGGAERVGVEKGGAALALAGLAGPSERLSPHI